MSTMPNTRPAEDLYQDPQTRVDFAHRSGWAVEAPAQDLLEAIAGRDATAASVQLRGQALELAALLRDKQQLLEQREAELNARSAMLESELRTARLGKFREPRPMISTDDGEEPLSGISAEPAAADDRQAPPLDVAEVAGRQPDDSSTSGAFGKERSDVETMRRVGRESTGTTDPTARGQRPAEARSPNASSHPEEPRATAANAELEAEFEHLEQMRQQLRQREERLERRERHVEQLHDEITDLHREALELRLASEQTWSDLKEEFPSEDLSRSMAKIRNKIADHYRLAHDTLARRKDELHELRNELTLQEQRLRQQRRDIQMWADRRYDEIESRLAKIILRERELDQLEGEFQRQSFEWQQQREAYREEIEQLTWQLHERSAS